MALHISIIQVACSPKMTEMADRGSTLSIAMKEDKDMITNL
jgi:hypothetical protein